MGSEQSEPDVIKDDPEPKGWRQWRGVAVLALWAACQGYDRLARFLLGSPDPSG